MFNQQTVRMVDFFKVDLIDQGTGGPQVSLDGLGYERGLQ
jgi:hypothetical protein